VDKSEKILKRQGRGRGSQGTNSHPAKVLRKEVLDVLRERESWVLGRT
jgi:hypothetical protein